MMSPLISTVLLLCYCSLAVSEGNIAVTVDNGKTDTIVCKLKKRIHIVEFRNEYENETFASCYSSECIVNPDYSGQFTISCDVFQQTFYLKIENISIYLGKKFYCKDGENSGFVIFNNTETKVDELEESQKHDHIAVSVIAVSVIAVAVLAVIAVKAARMFCVKKRGIYDDRNKDGDNGTTTKLLHKDNNEDADTDEKKSNGDVGNGLLQDNVGKQKGLKQSLLCDCSTLSSRPGDSTNSHVTNSGCEGNLVGYNGRDLVHLDQVIVEKAVTSTDEEKSNGDVGNGPLLKTSIETKGSHPIQNSASISLTPSLRRGDSANCRVINTRLLLGFEHWSVREQRENFCEESQSKIDSNSGKVSKPNLEEQGDGNLMNNNVHKDSTDDISTVKKEITKIKAVSPRTGTSIVKQLDGSEEKKPCSEVWDQTNERKEGQNFSCSRKVSEPNLEEQGDGNLMNNNVHKDSMDDISTVKKEITKIKAVSPMTGTSIVKHLDGSEEEECVELLSTFIPEFKNAPLNFPLSLSVSDRTKPCS